jgi:hypothetical protein
MTAAKTDKGRSRAAKRMLFTSWFYTFLGLPAISTAEQEFEGLRSKAI